MHARQRLDPARLQGQFGRHEIRRPLARGGMAAVYLAYEPQLDREVALKVPLLTGAEAADDVLTRFTQAARAGARLNHPNICPVYDAGTVDGLPYLTMAYVNGMTLAAWLERGGSFAPERAAHLVRLVAGALAEAHRQGVIHRDVKSSNVMLNARGEPFLIDFGLARRLAGDPRLTQPRAVLGSPAYMAPEQVRGEGRDLTHACDVYALGVVLYEALTRTLPFRADSVAEMLARILTDAPPLPSALRPDVPPALDRVCARAMAKAANDRYPSMAAMIADLDAYLAPNRSGVTPAGWGDPRPGEFSLVVDDTAPPTPGHTVLATPLPGVPEAPPAPVADDRPDPPTPQPPRAGRGAARALVKGSLSLAALGVAAVLGSTFIPQGDFQRWARPAIGEATPAPPDRAALDGWRRKAEEATTLASKEAALRKSVEAERDDVTADLEEAERELEELKALGRGTISWLRLENPTEITHAYEMRHQRPDGGWDEWHKGDIAPKGHFRWQFPRPVRVQIRFDRIAGDAEVTWKTYDLDFDRAAHDRQQPWELIGVRYRFEHNAATQEVDVRRVPFAD